MARGILIQHTIVATRVKLIHTRHGNLERIAAIGRGLVHKLRDSNLTPNIVPSSTVVLAHQHIFIKPSIVVEITTATANPMRRTGTKGTEQPAVGNNAPIGLKRLFNLSEQLGKLPGIARRLARNARRLGQRYRLHRAPRNAGGALRPIRLGSQARPLRSAAHVGKLTLQRHVAGNIASNTTSKPASKPASIPRPGRTQLGLKGHRDHVGKVRCVGCTTQLLQLRTQQIGIQGNGIPNAHVAQACHALQHQSPRGIVCSANPVRRIGTQLYLDKRKRLLQAGQQLGLVLHAQKGSIAALHLQRAHNTRLLASACKRSALNAAHVPVNSPHGRLARSVLGSLSALNHAQQLAGARLAHQLPAIVLLKRRLPLGHRLKAKQLVEQLTNRTLVCHGRPPHALRTNMFAERPST